MRSMLLVAALVFGATTALAQPVTTPAPTPAVTPTPPAPPRPRPAQITTLTNETLVTALVRAGFAAEVKTEAGQSFAIAKMGGQAFQAVLSGCQSPGVACTDIELFAGFSGQRIAWERLNGWNARTRFTRAFLDEQRNPALQMDISVLGGVSPEALKSSLATWGSALDTFSLFLAARVPPVGGATTTTPAPADPLTLPPRAQQKK